MADTKPSALFRPVDYALSTGIAVVSFVVLFVNYWFPPGEIFDEVYFVRAAQEYLTRQYIYENTHPPVTKLLITLSTMLFGGMNGGNDAHGWRFLDVLFGALTVWLLYALAKRITRSSLFAAYAAGLFACDGMHFVQSRIATPESFVVFFSVATLYTFYRYWSAAQLNVEPKPTARQGWIRASGALAAAAIATAFALIRFRAETPAAIIVAGVIAFAALYLAYRFAVEPYFTRNPRYSEATLWMLLFSISIALLVSSKWYGVMAYGVALAIVAGVSLQRFLTGAPRWGDPRTFRLDLLPAMVVFVTGAIYFAAYTPQFIGLRDLPASPPRAYTLSDVVSMQYSAFEYHEHLNDGGRNTHPYSSKWWQWPLDLRPILYYAQYGGSGNRTTAAMIYTLPNPLLLWLGLLTVPWIGYLALREHNKGYALLALTYLAQWLPWMASPRIAFAYHFYVDIPLICLCNAIAAQRLLQNARERGNARLATIGVVAYFVLVVASFVFFYPILTGMTIPRTEWMYRMWLPSWV